MVLDIKGKQIWAGLEQIPVVGEALLGNEFLVIGKDTGPEYDHMFMMYAPESSKFLVYPYPMLDQATEALEEVRKQPTLSDVNLYRMRIILEKVIP